MEEKVRYNFDPVISRLGTQAEKYDARERYFGTNDVEPFWVADMDLASPTFLMDALRARIDHSLFGYTEQDESLFTAIRWWMSTQHGVEVAQEAISLSPSVVTTISMAVQAFTAPDEGVVVLSPVYGPFFTSVEIQKRKVADCPLLVQEGRFEIDFDLLENYLSDATTRLMLLCNPQNPGGRVWRSEELEHVAQLCSQYGVVLFSDEIHSDIVYAPARHRSVLNVAAAKDNCVVAHSIGKTFNTSGLKSSFSMVPDSGLRTRLRHAHRMAHADNINLLGKVAITHLLSPSGAEYRRQLVEYLQENTRQVVERLQAAGTLAPMVPEATFLVWCDFRQHGPWQEVSKRLIHKARIALSGGSFFGPAGEGWFRINCGHPRAPLLSAVERIVAEFR